MAEDLEELKMVITPSRNEPTRGECHGRSKLNEEKVKKIRQLWNAGGIRHQDLAEMFGVVDSTIAAVLSGKNWSHVN